MGTITRRTDSAGKATDQVKIRRKGYPPASRTFAGKLAADNASRLTIVGTHVSSTNSASAGTGRGVFRMQIIAAAKRNSRSRTPRPGCSMRAAVSTIGSPMIFNARPMSGNASPVRLAEMMTKNAKNAAAPDMSAAPPADTAESVLALTVAGNRIVGAQVASNEGAVNPYALRNELLIERTKQRVRYKNGITLPVSAEALRANADDLAYNHRRKLATNAEKVHKQTRPGDRDQRWGQRRVPAEQGRGAARVSTGPVHRARHRFGYHMAVFRELQFDYILRRVARFRSPAKTPARQSANPGAKRVRRTPGHRTASSARNN